MVEISRKGVDLEACCGLRLLAVSPSPGRRHLQCRNGALRLGFRKGLSMAESTSSVVIPAQPIPFRHPMTRLRERLAGAGSVKIAALGSSTTAGEGGIVPYPQRLETFLRTNDNPKFKGRNFDVL